MEINKEELEEWLEYFKSFLKQKDISIIWANKYVLIKNKEGKYISKTSDKGIVWVFESGDTRTINFLDKHKDLFEKVKIME